MQALYVKEFCIEGSENALLNIYQMSDLLIKLKTAYENIIIKMQTYQIYQKEVSDPELAL